MDHHSNLNLCGCAIGDRYRALQSSRQPRASVIHTQYTNRSIVDGWPILILLFIGSFSLPVLFKQQEIPEGEVNIKVTGYQWYWGYEYTDHDFAFDSYMIGQPATVGNYVLTDEVEAALVEAGYSRNEFLWQQTQPWLFQ